VYKLEYNGKSQKSITQSLEASYVQVQWFDMLRSWLHLLLADEGLHILDIYLATALLKKCGWFSSDEQKNRIATTRKLTDQNYEWAAAMVRAEIYKVEDGSRLITRGKMPGDSVGMGFTATKVTPHLLSHSAFFLGLLDGNHPLLYRSRLGPSPLPTHNSVQ
jgi:hypothetical protein